MTQDLILCVHCFISTFVRFAPQLFHFLFSVLAAQLRSVQEELDSLEEEKASELWEAQEELRVAQEEVQELQQAAEEAAAERENDIALLQEELCRLRAELERLLNTTQEYELELTTLRAEISMKRQRREEQPQAGTEGQLYSTPLQYSILHCNIIFNNQISKYRASTGALPLHYLRVYYITILFNKILRDTALYYNTFKY